MGPVTRSSLAEGAARELRAAIRSGQYRPGERLYQDELARALAVSRTPLRQALVQLAREGLVEVARTGYRVAEPEVRHVLEMFEVCAAIEASTTRLAALHADERWLERLERAARTAPLRPSRDPEGEPTEFHDLVAAAAANPLLARLRPIARSALDLSFADTAALAGRKTEERSRAEHRAIVRAISSRDAERAARLAAEHVLAGRRRLTRALGFAED